MIVVGIDASNIKAGGGLTHLTELIINYPVNSKNKLVVFAGKKVLDSIPDLPYVDKAGHAWLNKGSLYNLLWRLFFVRSAAKKNKIDLMFTPGGNFLLFKPYVSMSQNMLVFESKERNRFPSFLDRMRYILLEFKQVLSFRFASGIIYISEYAGNYIQNKYPFLRKKTSAVIYHGVAERFNNKNSTEKLNLENGNKPFRLLYVSIINYYKHQDKLIEGILKLKGLGVPVELHLIGPLNPKLKTSFESLLHKAGDCVKYYGKISYDKIHEYYANCDLFVFASTCENMPNILVEAMKANIPVLCSNYGPMPEILKDGGLYFDPLNVDDFCEKVMLFRNSADLRVTSAKKAGMLSLSYSWASCAEQTFAFIDSCIKK